MTIKEWLLGKKIEGSCSVIIRNTETGVEYEGPIRPLKTGEVVIIWRTQAPYRQNSLLMRILTGRTTQQLAN